MKEYLKTLVWYLTYPLVFYIRYPYSQIRRRRARGVLRAYVDSYDFDEMFGTETNTPGPNNYGPTQVRVFHEIMEATSSDHQGRVFVDIGAGKGRVALLACQRPFKRIIGLETHFGHLCTAERNVEQASRKLADTRRIEFQGTDAYWWVARKWPDDPVFLFMYRPFLHSDYRGFFDLVVKQTSRTRKDCILAFVNPPLELEQQLRSRGFGKVAEKGTSLSEVKRVIACWQCFRRSESMGLADR